MNLRFVALVVLALTGAGCSASATGPLPASTPGLRFVPADGDTAVRLDAVVTLDFGTAVERGPVEDGVRLLAEPDMFGACPDAAMGSHGTMESAMDDTLLLRHMSEVHATAGMFSWNPAGTVCTFRPDSLLRPQSRYMLRLSGMMLGRMGHAGSGMVGGRMNAAGDRMLHFRTTTADDHAGHH